MSVKRRQAKKREDLSAEQEAWLQGFDRAACFFAFLPKDELAGFWAEHGDRDIEEHVAQWPGTRPSRWWNMMRRALRSARIPTAGTTASYRNPACG